MGEKIPPPAILLERLSRPSLLAGEGMVAENQVRQRKARVFSRRGVGFSNPAEQMRRGIGNLGERFSASQ